MRARNVFVELWLLINGQTLSSYLLFMAQPDRIHAVCLACLCYEVAFAENIRLGFCAFNGVRPCEIEKTDAIPTHDYVLPTMATPCFSVDAHK
jgi:hypothetical protein